MTTDDIDASCQADNADDDDDKTSVTVATNDDDHNDKPREDDKSDKTAADAGDNESLSAKLDLNVAEESGSAECQSDVKSTDTETSTDTRPSCSPSNNSQSFSLLNTR